MNAPAVLHRKILGMPVWAVGGAGAVGVILFHFFHTPSVGGAEAGTTPASTDATTGDPYAVDTGQPVGVGYGPNVGGGGSSDGYGYSGGAGGGDTSYADALASLGDSLAGLAPVDNSQDFADIEKMLGTIADQTAPDHSEGTEHKTTKDTGHKVAADKAKDAHAKARGGHAASVPKKSPAKAKAKAPAKKAAPVTHPKAKTVEHHAPPKAAPKPKPKPKPKPMPSQAHRAK